MRKIGNLLGSSSPSSGSSSRQHSSTRATPATPAPAAAAASAATTTTPAPATPANAAPMPVATPAAPTKAPIQLSDLQSILSGIKSPPGASGLSGSDVDLSQGLTIDVLQPLLENEEFVRKMKDLLPAVPGEEAVQDAATEIKGTVLSPQVVIAKLVAQFLLVANLTIVILLYFHVTG